MRSRVLLLGLCYHIYFLCHKNFIHSEFPNSFLIAIRLVAGQSSFVKSRNRKIKSHYYEIESVFNRIIFRRLFKLNDGLRGLKFHNLRFSIRNSFDSLFLASYHKFSLIQDFLLSISPCWLEVQP